MRSRCLGVTTIGVAISVAALAQQPVRDAGLTRTGTGVIAGVVTTDEPNHQAIARARVVLNGAELRPSLAVIADNAGRFAFTNLPPGQFTVTASKPGYLTMANGQATPSKGSGVPLSLTDGQQITNVALALPRAGAIAGRIRDERGQPMAAINVMLLQYRTLNGGRSLTTAPCCDSTKTDGAGAYRFHGVVPGDYLVSAVPAGDYLFIGTGQWFPPNNEDTHPVDAAEMQWALRQVAAGGRGASAPTPITDRAPLPGPAVAYGRVFFPSGADAARAETITLRAGEERTGVDLAMTLQRVARVEGRIAWPDGQPIPNTMIGWTDDSRATLPPPGLINRRVFPGHYTIVIRAGTTMWGTQDVDVAGEDVTGVTIALGPSASISGKVVFDSTSTSAPDPRQVRISVRPISLGSTPVMAAADGTFIFPSVDPGRYSLNATIAPAAPARGGTPPAAPTPATPPIWFLKSAMLDGKDVADVALELAPHQQLTGVVITLTDRATDLSGTLLDASGRPAPGYYVVVFSQDESMWAQGSRRLPAPVRAATDGKYRFTGLPPGNYYLAALTNVDQNDLADAAFLKQIAASAIVVTLADGERKTQDLKFANR